MQLFRQDLRFAWCIVASLAIGIAANTVIFSVVNGLILRPLPYPNHDQLANLWLRSPGINNPRDWPAPFEDISIFTGASATLSGLEQPEQIEGLRTSSSFFKLRGARNSQIRLI